MAIIPYGKNNWFEPFNELESIQREVNNLFDFSLDRKPWRQKSLFEGQWSPQIDVYDTKDNLTVKVDAPGLNKDEIDVSMENNFLIVTRSRKLTTTKQNVSTEAFTEDCSCL
jgi:HSP20 family protein